MMAMHSITTISGGDHYVAVTYCFIKCCLAVRRAHNRHLKKINSHLLVVRHNIIKKHDNYY